MKNNFTLEITDILFSPLKNWAEKTSGNWNLLIGVGFLLLVVGGILTYVYQKKIGETDERTHPIFLKSLSIILAVVILFDIIFPKEYMWQIFFLFKYSFAFLASGIYLATRYISDFKS